MFSEGFDDKRMNSILQIDAQALLITLRELEGKLSDYNRQDTVPYWADSILPRLDLLEISIGPKKLTSSENLTDYKPDNNLLNENFLERIVSEIDTRSEMTRLSVMKIYL
jgi:hypothetical protein